MDSEPGIYKSKADMESSTSISSGVRYGSESMHDNIVFDMECKINGLKKELRDAMAQINGAKRNITAGCTCSACTYLREME